MGSPGLLAGAVGEGGDRRFSSEESAGRLPASDVHDAGSRRGGGESVQRMAGARASGAVEQMEGQTVEERDGVRTTVTSAWALAHRYFLHQHQRDVLLFVQRVGRLQPLHRALGFA